MTEILHLKLKRQWFDLVALGTKRFEFRDATPYWEKRLEGRAYKEIHFRNGYHRTSPFMRVEFLGIEESDDKYVIALGKILEITNWPAN